MADDKVPLPQTGGVCSDNAGQVAADNEPAELPTPNNVTTADTDVGTSLDVAAPTADGSLPFAAEEVVASEADMCFEVEAFGSGVQLHPGLHVASDATVGDLRKLVQAAVVLPSRTRTLRLFVGHGGTELGDDSAVVSQIPAVVDVDDQLLVVFPIQCTFYAWLTRMVCSGHALTRTCNLYVDRARSRCPRHLWLVQSSNRSRS